MKLKSNLKSVVQSIKKVSEDELIEIVATKLADGKAVGWMQGRMEFGPRALGGRRCGRSSLTICKSS